MAGFAKVKYCGWVRFGFCQQRWQFVCYHEAVYEREALIACRRWILRDHGEVAEACRRDVDGELVILPDGIPPVGVAVT